MEFVDLWQDPLTCKESYGPQLLAFSWAMMAIAVVAVLLRLYFKIRHVNKIGWDDYTIVLSLVRMPIEIFPSKAHRMIRYLLV